MRNTPRNRSAKNTPRFRGDPEKTTQRPAKHAPRAPRTPFLLLILGLVIGGMCALLALNTASAANELQRHDYAAADESVANEVAALENAVAASGAPGNIAAAAARLGMVPAGNPAFFVVKPDGSIQLMGSPAAASGYPTYVPPKTTPKSTPKSTPKTTPKSTAKSTSRSASTSASTSATKTSPTPSPTPNTTLPGGVR